MKVENDKAFLTRMPCLSTLGCVGFLGDFVEQVKSCATHMSVRSETGQSMSRREAAVQWCRIIKYRSVFVLHGRAVEVKSEELCWPTLRHLSQEEIKVKHWAHRSSNELQCPNRQLNACIYIYVYIKTYIGSLSTTLGFEKNSWVLDLIFQVSLECEGINLFGLQCLSPALVPRMH